MDKQKFPATRTEDIHDDQPLPPEPKIPRDIAKYFREL
jgi:hypothetical protein